MVWALVAGSALFWGLRLTARPLPVPAQAQVAEPAAALQGDLGRLLGNDPAPVAEAAAEAPPPAADARFVLMGVVNPHAAKAAREGLALIAVDGKPARAYRVGAAVENSHVLKSVGARGATLGLRDGPGVVALSLAALPGAATGVLPQPVNDAATGAVVLPPGVPDPSAGPATRLPTRQGRLPTLPSSPTSPNPGTEASTPPPADMPVTPRTLGPRGARPAAD